MNVLLFENDEGDSQQNAPHKASVEIYVEKED